MISKAVRSSYKTLQHVNKYCLLDHSKMDDLKKMLFAPGSEESLKLKAKFLWRETKYTLIQGSKDLWSDVKWIFRLYKRKYKESHDFTGYEIAESHRIKIDMIKFIPYSVILTVPLAELSLPIILWLFPNAIPSFYLFDTAFDQRIEQLEQVQFESHKILIEKLMETLSSKLKRQPFVFSRYDLFKQNYFDVIDEIGDHLNYNNFSSDELIVVLEFLGGGDYVTGTATFNKIINLFTMNIPRVTYKILRFLYGKIFRVELKPYKDPFFVNGDFKIFKFNYFPFEFLKRKFLIWQINRKYRYILKEDKAFEKYGMDDVVGVRIKQFARYRGLCTLSCYETLKNVLQNDWIKFTTHPKFKDNNTKLWFSVVLYQFLKVSSREIN